MIGILHFPFIKNVALMKITCIAYSLKSKPTIKAHHQKRVAHEQSLSSNATVHLALRIYLEHNQYQKTLQTTQWSTGRKAGMTTNG